MINTAPKPFVFVLMPFSSDFDDIYHLGIKKACENTGAYAERVDEQIYQETILERLINQIFKADIIISDMTGKNPNVFYETGYAHALNKTVILLTQNADDIPFDLKHYPHIVYGKKIVKLIPELERTIKYYLDHKNDTFITLPDIDIYIDGISIRYPIILNYEIPSTDFADINFKLDLNNNFTNNIESIKCQIGLETPNTFTFSYIDSRVRSNKIKQSDNRILHLYQKKFDILPGSWDSCSIDLVKTIDNNHFGNNTEEFNIKIFTPNGMFGYPFKVIFKPKK
jgi:hypothetical protein